MVLVVRAYPAPMVAADVVPALRRALGDLARPLEAPWESDEPVEDAWMELMDLEGLVAGLVETVLHNDRVRSDVLRSISAVLRSPRPLWVSRWPDRLELLDGALSLLREA